ncbi:MAG: DUF3540 domain-containing protein [Herbaspirillum sp.]
MSKLVSLTRPGVDQAPGLNYATVTGRAGNWFFLKATTPLPSERAQRAASCLIEPECGDTVLLCAGGGTQAGAYILAVLTRADNTGATLHLPGAVEMTTQHGKLRVNATQLELTAHDSVSLQAPKIELDGLAGKLQFHRIDANAQEFNGRIGNISLLAQNVHSTVDRLIQKARNSFRWIENLDETRAGRVRMQITDRFQLKARHASMIAEDQVKIDGKKIDLG